MLKKILSDFGAYGVAPFIPKVANIFVLPLITPYLTKFDYSVWGVIIAYVYFAQIFLTLSLQVNLSNSFFKSAFQYKWLWRQIYGFWTLWSIIFVVILTFLLFFVIPVEVNSNLWIIIGLVVTPTLLFGPVEIIANTYYQLNKKPKEIVLRNVLFGILSVVLIWYFISDLRLGYMGWFYAGFISEILLKLSWFYNLNFKLKLKPILNFKYKTIKNALKVSLPLIPHSNALYVLNQSDRVVMDVMNVPLQNIGSYNASYSIANIFETLSTAFSVTMVPYIYQMYKVNNQKLVRTYFFISQSLFFMAIIIYSLFAKEIVDFLFRNDDFKDLYPLTVLIMASMSFKPMYMASTLIYFFNEQTKKISIYSFIAGGLNIILNFIFIPIFGFEAAIVSTIIGFLFLAYSRFFSTDFKILTGINYYPIIWIFVSISVPIVSYILCKQTLNFRLITFLTISILLVITAIVFFRLKKNNKI